MSLEASQHFDMLTDTTLSHLSPVSPVILDLTARIKNVPRVSYCEGLVSRQWSH